MIFTAFLSKCCLHCSPEYPSQVCLPLGSDAGASLCVAAIASRKAQTKGKMNSIREGQQGRETVEKAPSVADESSQAIGSRMECRLMSSNSQDAFCQYHMLVLYIRRSALHRFVVFFLPFCTAASLAQGKTA